jgi:WD40 repeat protein
MLFSVVVLAALASRGEAQTFELVPQLGHTESVRSVAISPDGRLALSGGETFRMWDMESGALLHSEKVHNGQVNAIAIAANTQEVYTGGYGLIHAWDLKTGKRRLTLRGEGDVHALAVSADGKSIASSDDEHIHVWDVAKKAVVKTLDGHERQVASLTFSPDGRTLVSAGEDYSIRIWSLPQGTSRVIKTGGLASSKVERGARISTYSGHSVHEVAFSPRERVFASAARDGVTLWNADTAAKIRTLTGHDWPGVETIAFSADATKLVSGGGDKTLRVYDVKSGKSLAVMKGHDLGVSAVAISRDGTRVLSGSGDKSLRLWDPSSGKHLWTFRGYIDSVEAVAFSPDGRWALAASGRNSVGTGPKPPLFLWNVEQLSLRRTLVEHTEQIVSVAFSPDGKKAVSGAMDDTLVLWDLASGTAERRFMDMTAGGTPDRRRGAIGVQAVAFSPDGQTVAAACSDGWIRLFRAADGDMRKLAGDERGSVDALAFVGDGRKLLAGGWNQALRLFDVESGKELRRFAAHMKWGISLAVSADGKLAVSSSFDRQSKVWDLQSGRMLRQLDGAAGPNVALTADGRTAAVGSEEAIVLYDVDTGKQRAVLRGHREPTTALAFSPNGKHLMSTSYDGTARLWKVDGGASVSLSALGEEWLAHADDGYFDASRNGGQLVAAIDDMKAFRIDQMAVRNNRPDMLLERMGLGTQATREHFAALYRRRLSRLGLTEGQLAASFEGAPRAAIARADRSDDKFVDLSINLQPGAAPLKSYQVYVNAVPLFGATGKPASPGAIDERVELTSGRNLIEVGAFDSAGLESLRATRAIAYDGAAAGDLYFVGFGVSRYRDSRLNLGFADKDVLDVGSALRHASGYGRVEVRTYVNEQVTRQAIADAKQLLEKARVDDTVVLMVAGHGVHARDAAADYYFVTHDTDVKRLSETAAPFAALQELLEGIAPRRKLFLLDTCESGERDEAASANVNAAGARGMKARTTRALVFEGGTRQKARPFLFDRDRYILYDLMRRSGAIVLSSSTGDELSYERDELQNGVFTEALLQALISPAADLDNDQQLSVRELSAFVAKSVGETTSGFQHPVIDRDNPAVDLKLPLLPASAVPADRPVENSDDSARVGPGARGCFCTAGQRAPRHAPLAWLTLLLLALRRSRGCRWYALRP